MSEPAYIGVPGTDDVVAQYRLHADLIANGQRPRPARALIVEFYPDQLAAECRLFGVEPTSRPEGIGMLCESAIAIAEAVQDFNAQDGH